MLIIGNALGSLLHQDTLVSAVKKRILIKINAVGERKTWDRVDGRFSIAMATYHSPIHSLRPITGQSDTFLHLQEKCLGIEPLQLLLIYNITPFMNIFKK